ncbi:ER membrane chaperone for multipass membrane protein [Schizosaccharomyces osmophilus]|uniref:ER membrane chaperone for multipass membrane protein n=1 Tax=Schizosaccharomyces osmophilus TaxID=2545709 RepID=A0AAE9WEQ9_9SCHI|nr:ER membrane chaperone for multipass membrane protein [Schizosaccharomyces osmophilus]WBW73896.1 ER membrane chaperone for multipass membrane protein [Schizosaccharomyces osmophilus]
MVRKVLMSVLAFISGALATDESSEESHTTEEFIDTENSGMLRKVHWQDFKIELIVLSVFALYVVSFITKKRKNADFASRWYNSLQTLLRNQFSQYGPGRNMSPVIDVSPTEYSSYLTGRVNVKNVYTTLQLFPRQDLFTYGINQLVEIFMGNVMSPVLPAADRFQLILNLGNHAKPWQPFVFAIVRKDCMRILRETRFDLSFTRISSHPLLPETHVLMSENLECTERVLNLPQFLPSLQSSMKNLEYLIVTDQPAAAPANEKEYMEQPRIDASMRVDNVGTFNELENPQANDLLNTLLLIADNTSKFQWRPEITKKLTSSRKLALEEVVHASAAAKAAKSKKSTASDVSNLSESEQKKRVDKERQRKIKKRSKRA